MSLFAELKRRRVFRAMIAYGIVAFALLQVVEPIMHGTHLPEVTLTFVVVVLGLGFPVVVVLAWAFDVSAVGIARAPTESSAHSLRDTRLALALMSIGLLAAAPGITWYLVRDRTRPRGGASMTVPSDPVTPTMAASLAVLPFVDMSADKDQEYF